MGRSCFDETARWIRSSEADADDCKVNQVKVEDTLSIAKVKYHHAESTRFLKWLLMCLVTIFE